MDVKINYVCGICQKAFTKNSSLKRHKTIVHLSTRYNCLTCTKVYRRREDMIKHSKICLKATLEDDTPDIPESPTSKVTSVSNTPTESETTATPNRAPISTIIEDLTLSDSDEEVTSHMGRQIENQLLTTKMSRQTNTDISCTQMVDKSTNTEPLIVITPDEILDLGEKLSLLTFDKGLKIFVDTVNSQYKFLKPNLSRSTTPTTQIGLLKAQPSACRGSQTKATADFPPQETPKLLSMPLDLPHLGPNPHSSKQETPTLDTQVDISKTPQDIETGSQSPDNSLTTNTTLEEMCQRKPTRPSLFIPPCKRTKLAATLKKI